MEELGSSVASSGEQMPQGEGVGSEVRGRTAGVGHQAFGPGGGRRRVDSFSVRTNWGF